MHKTLEISKLQPGMVITEVTKQNGPVHIKKSGLVTSTEMVAGLREMGVQEVVIDESQTVELAEEAKDVDGPQSVSSTRTQELFTTTQYTPERQSDAHLHDQFNRNLFLPVAQDIPAAWVQFAKQAGIACAVICAGLLTGFGVAMAPSVFVRQGEAVADRAPVHSVETKHDVIETAPMPSPAPLVTAVSQEVPKPEEPPVIPAETPEPELIPAQSNAVESEEAPKVAVSPELMRKFTEAVEALEDEPDVPDIQPIVKVRDGVQRVDQLPPRIMTTLPGMSFSAHMYASSAEDRWVTVNGKKLREGDWIDNLVEIVSIDAQRVVLRHRGETFSMSALTEW